MQAEIENLERDSLPRSRYHHTANFWATSLARVAAPAAGTQRKTCLNADAPCSRRVCK